MNRDGLQATGDGEVASSSGIKNRNPISLEMVIKAVSHGWQYQIVTWALELHLVC